MKNKIIGTILFVIISIIGTEQLWLKQLWPDGYYKNIPQYTEEETTDVSDVSVEQESTDNSEQEGVRDDSNNLENEVGDPNGDNLDFLEEKTTESGEDTTENDEEDATALDKVYGLDYYNQLTDKQKKVYRQMQEACKKYQSKIKIDSVKKGSCNVALYAFTCDHPEFYWLNNKGTTYQMINGKVVEIQLDIDKNAKENRKKIAIEADKIISKAEKYSTNYDKIKYLYKSLVDLADYKEGKHDQDIRSVFLEKNTVCNGYSEAFLYLCKSVGINCAYAHGTGGDEAHAWNIVEIHGKYYWVDVTWGDPSADTSKTRDKISYRYLCVPDKEFFRNHALNKGIDEKGNNKEYFEYPKCTDTMYYYFQQEGCYFTKYDQKALKSYISKSVKKNLYKEIEIKFSNKKSYKAAFEYLIAKGKINDMIGKNLVKKVNGYSYINDDKTYYISIKFKKNK